MCSSIYYYLVSATSSVCIHVGGLGGAVGIEASNFTLIQSVFEQNSAQSQGGAISMANSTGRPMSPNILWCLTWNLSFSAFDQSAGLVSTCSQDTLSSICLIGFQATSRHALSTTTQPQMEQASFSTTIQARKSSLILAYKVAFFTMKLYGTAQQASWPRLIRYSWQMDL